MLCVLYSAINSLLLLLLLLLLGKERGTGNRVCNILQDRPATVLGKERGAGNRVCNILQDRPATR